MSLLRDLTHIAFIEYLNSDAKLAPLADGLDDSVDSNVVIEAIKQWGSCNPLALRPYLPDSSMPFSLCMHFL